MLDTINQNTRNSMKSRQKINMTEDRDKGEIMKRDVVLSLGFAQLKLVIPREQAEDISLDSGSLYNCK
jgi:hypothetical protein